MRDYVQAITIKAGNHKREEVYELSRAILSRKAKERAFVTVRSHIRIYPAKFARWDLIQRY